MSGKNFMSFGDADTILTEFSNDIKSRVSTKANQGLTAQQIANAKANIDIDKVPNVATNDQTPTFLEESTRTNIASGDKLSLIFGKIKKFFSDLKAVAFSGSYNDLTNKPTIPSKLSDLTADASHRTVSDTEKSTWNGKANTSDIPTALSQLTDDSTHRVVTDTEKTTWNGISRLTTPTLLWEGYATVVDNTYNMTGNYTDYKYLLVVAKTNIEEKNILIPTSRISSTIIFSDVLSAGAWDSSTNAFTYNSCYGIKFTAANKFQLAGLTYNNSNWILKPVKIYGIG